MKPAALPCDDTPLDEDNLAAHACHSLATRHVRAVIMGGRVVLRDGELTTVNETEVLDFCCEQAQRL